MDGKIIQFQGIINKVDLTYGQVFSPAKSDIPEIIKLDGHYFGEERSTLLLRLAEDAELAITRETIGHITG